MIKAIETLPVVLLLAVGIPACVDGPEPTALETASLASNVTSLSVAMPDAAGVLHNAVVVVSSDLALRAQDFARGVEPILRPGKPARGATDDRAAFQQRTASASASVAAAVSSGQTAVVAIVFEDSAVIGWRGPMLPAVEPDGGAQTNGGRWFSESLQTFNPSVPVPSGTFVCPAGAGARGSMVFGTTSTVITWFRQSLAIMPPAVLPAPGIMYLWPANFFQDNNATYHITSQQVGPVGLTTGVNSAIECYWFGL